MDVNEYLKRMKCEAFKEVSLENLKMLQKKHLETFSYENVDIPMGKRVELSLEKIYDRFMNQSRGGYCLELNAIFGWLLGELGYDYIYVPSYVYIPLLKRYLADKTHMVIIVKLNGNQYYVDVGLPRFMDNTFEIVFDRPERTLFGTFRFKKDESESEFFIFQRISNKDFSLNEDNWTTFVRFKIVPFKLNDFQKMNDILHYKDFSIMPYKTMCSKQKANSMILLVGWKFSEITFNDEDEYRTDTILSSEEVRKVTREKFGLIIDDSFEPINDEYPVSLCLTPFS